jgi:hypothetical protein
MAGDFAEVAGADSMGCERAFFRVIWPKFSQLQVIPQKWFKVV